MYFLGIKNFFDLDCWVCREMLRTMVWIAQSWNLLELFGEEVSTSWSQFWSETFEIGYVHDSRRRCRMAWNGKHVYTIIWLPDLNREDWNIVPTLGSSMERSVPISRCPTCRAPIKCLLVPLCSSAAFFAALLCDHDGWQWVVFNYYIRLIIRHA